MYFTLITKADDGLWYPQFGDRDRHVVQEEMSEYRGERKIIKTQSSRQHLINAELDRLNERARRLRLVK